MTAIDSNHEHFRQLAVLASTGELSPAEAAELLSHLAGCDECCSAMRESFELTTGVLPELMLRGAGAPPVTDAATAPGIAAVKDLLSRKVREAKIETLPPAAAKRTSTRWRIAAWVAAAAILVAAGAGALVMRRALLQAGARASMAAADADRARERIAALESAQRDLLAQLGLKNQDARQLSAQGEEKTLALAQLESAHQAGLAKLNEMDHSLNGLSGELSSVRAEAASLRAERDRLAASLRNAESNSAQLTAQVNRLTQVEHQYSDLSKRVQAQEDAIQRQQMLLATDRDIRDLMGARNLHIIDVNDVDSSGKPKPTFGRMFYTEGKSLVFYAFDLGQLSKSAKPAAFQAWGQHSGPKSPPASLGIFYEDTKAQNRWILKFEDPAVLAQIDSVYVTVEPPSGSKTPHGAQVLFAYLGTPPNHR